MCAEDFALSPLSEEGGDVKKLEIIFLSLVSEHETTSYDRKPRIKFQNYTSP